MSHHSNPVTDNVAELLLSLQQLEGWYKCTNVECGHGFWRNLSPKATCPTPKCSHRCPPYSEVVANDGMVTSKFRCTRCRSRWVQRFAMTKACNKCEHLAEPADVRTSRGVGHARCSRCQRVSYDLDVGVGTTITCRVCRDASAPAVAMCSQQRRRDLDTLTRQNISLDVMTSLQQAIYVPGTQRTRHAHPIERTCAPDLSSPVVLCVNRMVAASPT